MSRPNKLKPCLEEYVKKHGCVEAVSLSQAKKDLKSSGWLASRMWQLVAEGKIEVKNDNGRYMMKWRKVE